MPISNKVSKLVIAFSLLLLVFILLYFFGVFSKDSSDLSSSQNDINSFGIAILVDSSKSNEVLKQNIIQGAEIARNLINEQGGILGKEVKLHIRTISHSQSNITSVLSELVQKKSVSLILSTLSDLDNLPIISQIQHLPAIFVSLSDGQIITCKKEDPSKVYPNVWSFGLTQEMTLEPFLTFLSEKIGVQEKDLRVYYFSTSERQSRKTIEFVMDVSESLGFETVASVYVDYRVEDYFQQVREIFGKRPDLLFVAASEAGTIRFLKQASKLGVKSEMKVAGLDTFAEEKVYTLGADMDGVYTISRYSPFLDNNENNFFVEQWQKLNLKDSNNPTTMAASAYGSLIIAKEIFNKAKSTDIQIVTKHLENLDINLPQGRVIANPQNHSLMLPLYAIRYNGSKPEVVEYLGEVSHPQLQNCMSFVEQGEEQKPIRHFED